MQVSRISIINNVRGISNNTKFGKIPVQQIQASIKDLPKVKVDEGWASIFKTHMRGADPNEIYYVMCSKTLGSGNTTYSVDTLVDKSGNVIGDFLSSLLITAN